MGKNQTPNLSISNEPNDSRCIIAMVCDADIEVQISLVNGEALKVLLRAGVKLEKRIPGVANVTLRTFGPGNAPKPN